jgi:uridylate kinase
MRIVVRVGGSVVASPVNVDLVREYVDVLIRIRRMGHGVAAVVGGGALARDFIAVAKELGLDEEAQDELAISVSRLFAQLFMKKLGRMGCRMVPLTVEDAVTCFMNGRIPVMGGLKPGMTTDTVAALVSEALGADLLIKGTDQDGIYDKDPRKHADAVKLDRVSVEDLSRILAEEVHKAGIHQVIDPEAVKILKRRRFKLVVVNGFKPENLLAVVEGRNVGTVVE